FICLSKRQNDFHFSVSRLYFKPRKTVSYFLMKFKLAHFSDIHFFKACKSPLQFFNRQFLGNFNYLFTRRKHFDQKLAELKAAELKQEGILSLLITGDFTCMASKAEFLQAKNFLIKLKNQGFKIYILPGNHDVYTKSAHSNKTFYKTL